MQLKKKKLVQQLGLAIFGATLALSASADVFTAAVTTIDDVTITEKIALDFGTTVFTTAGNCIMNSALPGTTIMEYTTTADATTEAAGYGATTGTSCVNTAGSDTTVTPGVWRVSGTGAGVVSLLVSTLAQGSADYTFVPDGGCYIAFDGGAGVNGDTCTTLVPGTVVVGATLADVALTEDDAGAVGTSATAGDLLFTLGGTLTVVNALLPEATLPLTFQVDVTY